MQKLHRTKKQGFTLLEILIVVAIIGLIASLILPNLMGRYEKSKEEIAKAQVEMLSTAVQSFIIDVGRCPYLSKRSIPKDPWGSDYQFKCPGEHGVFDLYSFVPNKKLDEKAITNW